MVPLLVRMIHTETGAEREAGFRRSPIRIGRNHLNDLTIDEGFVSQWHGIVRLEEDETRYLDVGSKNGTTYQGALLPSKEEVVLEEGAELRIGPIRLVLVRTALRDDQIVSRRASQFRLGSNGPATDGKAATMMLPAFTGIGGAGPKPAPAPAGSAPTPSASGEGDSPELREARQRAKRLKALLDRLQPLHEAYEAARGALEKAVDESLSEVKGAKDADMIVEELSRQVPLAFEIPGMRERAGLPAASAEVDLSAWLERLVPAGTAAPPPAQAMERAGALLEAFAMGLVQLREAQRDVMTRLQVQPSAEGSALHRIEDPRELISYLLDPRAPGETQVDEIARAFADAALHQIAMLNGAIEGARAILWEISPQQLGAVERGQLAKTSAGFGDWLWPFRAAGHYYRYAAKHTELGAGDRFQAFLFGSSFSRAYTRVTGSQGVRPSIPSNPRLSAT